MYNDSKSKGLHRCITLSDQDAEPHPLLAQVPLTVSPFVSLPTATTLPYTYKPLPSTLPPSSTRDANGLESENFVVSASGHAASPEDIVASCQALRSHLRKTQEAAEQAVDDWEQELRDEELAEKRRVAPGWLDRDEKILEPERKRADDSPSRGMDKSNSIASLMDIQDVRSQSPTVHQSTINTVGDDLDRAFGGLNVRKS